jgi:hypothetical protein
MHYHARVGHHLAEHFFFRAPVLLVRGGRSGYPKMGRVIRVFKISGFENWYPKLQRVLQYPKIQVPEISGSGSGIPELPELLCLLHKNTYTILN